MDKTLEMLCDRLLDEIEDTVKLDKLPPASMDMLDKAVDILKDLKEMDSWESDGGYSGKPIYRYGVSYDDGNTYRRNRGYARNSETIAKMEEMYDNAQSDKEREIIRKLMSQI